MQIEGSAGMYGGLAERGLRKRGSGLSLRAGMAIVGFAAGLLHTAIFHAISPMYRHDPAATVNLAGILFGSGCFTLAILILAANTSYQGFPRLAALLARDGYFPRQFVNLGDRLVLSNGMLILAGFSAALIVAFHANVNSLITLYVIRVFNAFCLSYAH